MYDLHTPLYLFYFILFLQSIVFSILFALGLLAGGIASAANAADVQDALDTLGQFCEFLEEFCDDAEQLRNSMAATAVSIYVYSVLYILIFTDIYLYYDILLVCACKDQSKNQYYTCHKVLRVLQSKYGTVVRKYSTIVLIIVCINNPPR